MKKDRCKYCRARHRSQFMLHFPDKSVCHDCACEYRKIFFSFQNRDTRRLHDRWWQALQHMKNSTSEPYKFNKIKRTEDGISEDS